MKRFALTMFEELARTPLSHTKARRTPRKIKQFHDVISVFSVRSVRDLTFYETVMLGALIVSFVLSPALMKADAGQENTEAKSTCATTLSQALAIADEQNRDIQKAREYSRWIYGKYLEERAQALPQMSLSGRVGREALREEKEGPLTLSPAGNFIPGTTRTTTDSRGLDVTLTQPLFTWGKVSAAVRAAKVALSTADQQLRLYRQATRRDVTAVFYDVLLAKELHAIAGQNLTQKERHLDEARKKFSMGTATDYDVLAAEVAVKNARPEVIRADNAVRIARERLQYLLGQESKEVDAAGTLQVVTAPISTHAAMFSTALGRRPEVLNQEVTITINEELVNIANAGDKPGLSFAGAYGKTLSSVDPYDIENRGWSAGLILSFPLFDGFRTEGQVIQAKSNLQSSRIDMTALKESISMEIQVALDQVREAMEILKALQGTVQQAERLLLMAEKGFEYGVKTRLDVDDAQVSLSVSKGNLARASRDYLVAMTNLKWVQGILGEE